LRTAWTSADVAEQTSESHEGLPEATLVHRHPADATAAGADHMAGDESYDPSDAREADGDETLRVPPDPPRRPDATAKDEV